MDFRLLQRTFRLILPAFPVLLSGLVYGQPVPPALDSLFSTERAFAKTSVRLGARDAFLRYFADDGITFRPGPAVFKEWAAAHPLPPGHSVTTLDWMPLTGGVSAAGDLGWDTGPYILTSDSSTKEPPSYGFFFTLWRHTDDDGWKVALDLGIAASDSTALFFNASPAASKPPAHRDHDYDRVVEPSLLTALDRATGATMSDSALGLRFADDARLMRNGLIPLAGRDAVMKSLRLYGIESGITPLRTRIAASGDLACTYGTYASVDLPRAKPEHGYYARIWRWEGIWKLVVDVTAPVQEAK